MPAAHATKLTNTLRVFGVDFTVGTKGELKKCWKVISKVMSAFQKDVKNINNQKKKGCIVILAKSEFVSRDNPIIIEA